jgi:hypothetical protein
MKQPLAYGLALAAFFAWLSSSQNGDAFIAANFAFWGFVAGIALGLMQGPSQPWAIDNPPAQWYPVDGQTIIHTVKSILIDANYDKLRWQVLTLDPLLGTLTASIDVVEPATYGGSCEDGNRRNILLIVEAREAAQQTRLLLRWRVRGGNSRVLCNEIIEDVSARIQHEMAMCAQPTLVH